MRNLRTKRRTSHLIAVRRLSIQFSRFFSEFYSRGISNEFIFYYVSTLLCALAVDRCHNRYFYEPSRAAANDLKNGSLFGLMGIDSKKLLLMGINSQFKCCQIFDAIDVFSCSYLNKSRCGVYAWSRGQ